MKNQLRKFKNWIIETAYNGTPWDLFILGVLGLVALVVASILIGYVK